MESESLICPFCFDELVSGIIRLQCGHELHSTCLEVLEEYNRCPICRSIINVDASNNDPEIEEDEFLGEEDYLQQVVLANVNELIRESSAVNMLTMQLRMLREMQDTDQAREFADIILNEAADYLEPDDLEVLLLEAEELFQ